MAWGIHVFIGVVISNFDSFLDIFYRHFSVRGFFRAP